VHNGSFIFGKSGRANRSIGGPPITLSLQTYTRKQLTTQSNNFLSFGTPVAYKEDVLGSKSPGKFKRPNTSSESRTVRSVFRPPFLSRAKPERGFSKWHRAKRSLELT
jgi:hypothetical protein